MLPRVFRRETRLCSEQSESRALRQPMAWFYAGAPSSATKLRRSITFGPKPASEVSASAQGTAVHANLHLLAVMASSLQARRGPLQVPLSHTANGHLRMIRILDLRSPCSAVGQMGVSSLAFRPSKQRRAPIELGAWAKPSQATQTPLEGPGAL